MATKPQFEQDAQKMAASNLVSYATSLRGLYKDKPRKEAPAAEVTTPKKRKLLGEDSLDEDTRKEL